MIGSTGEPLPCVMKLSHFRRFYQNTKGIPLLPEKADEEAAKMGILIDRIGESRPDTGLPPQPKADRDAA